MTECPHHCVRCLNGYELIRKYRCDDCGAVMMCACDEEIGRKHLPHQLNAGAELDTKIRVPVTAGFVANICEGCRSLPLTPYPKAAIFGQTSKIRRYYWREITFEEIKRFDAWSDANGHPPLSSPESIAAKKAIEKDVLADVKRLHATSPKYTYKNEADSEIVEKYSVEQVALQAVYTADPTGKGAIVLGFNGPCNVEEFVSDHYRALGYETLFLESVPFHVLFGVFMWLVVQDPSDPLVQIVGFGDRIAFEKGEAGEMVWSHHPQDFGSKGYAKRRDDAINEHLSSDWLEPGELQWLFDYWLGPSEKLRQYLWAHRDSDIQTARKLLDILPPSDIQNILRYLVDDYWHHYLGWPDLLVYRPGELFFAEVKSTGDKLSDEQKQWIRANHERLNFPFKLVKVHKAIKP
ncbi:ribosomal protein L37E [Bradyrhizobium sp. USDA 377]